MKTLLASALLSLLATGIVLASGVEPVENLRVTWVDGTSPSLTVRWTIPADGNLATITSYRVYRRVGGVAWPTTFSVVNATGSWSPGGEVTWTDTLATDAVLTAAVKGTMATISYRVVPYRSAYPTEVLPMSEVVTAGHISGQIYDTDGDGLTDAREVQLRLDPNNWSDATGDSDGDGVPNLWEEAYGTGIWDETEYPLHTTTSSVAPQMDGTNAAVLTVDPSQATSTYIKPTITAALAALAGGTTTNQRFRIIRVMPGTYAENLTVSANYRVAIVPLRSAQPAYSTAVGSAYPAMSQTVANALNSKRYNAQEAFELVGIASNPQKAIVTANGTLVMDSFRFKRVAGSRAALLEMGDDAVSTNAAMRLHQVRLVNCVASAVDTGVSPLIEQNRSRLVLAHCSFYMNQTDLSSPAHVYTSASEALGSTSRLMIYNSVFWNPLNLRSDKPEILSTGSITGGYCTEFRPVLNNVSSQNPGLTPDGWVAAPASAAYAAGGGRIFLSGTALPQSTWKDVHAIRDIHGEYRYQETLSVDANGQSLLVIGEADALRGIDVGADQFVDMDQDLVPDAEDRLAGMPENALADSDHDLLNELMEYLGSTDISSADSPYLTLNQAAVLFAPLQNSGSNSAFLTRVEANANYWRLTDAGQHFLSRAAADALYMPKAPTTPQVLRVAPGGNISMGAFGGSPNP